MSAPAEEEAVARLRRGAERSRFARGLGLALVALVSVAWLGGTINFAELFDARRGENLARFVRVEIVPPSVRSGAESWLDWLAARFQGRNLEALRATVALAALAAVLSGIVGCLLSLWTAQTACAAGDPFLGARPQRGWRQLAGQLARLACVGMRAVPEYVLAFLLGACFRDPAWACVLALTIHNGGILGRLYGETLENLDPRPARAWFDAGATRLVAVTCAQAPEAAPRGLTYLLLRFETCLRESTVLGAIGFVSLGHWIVQERAAGHYDEVLALVLLGAVAVVVADVLGHLLRATVRGAGAGFRQD